MDAVVVTCPYCFEDVELVLEADDTGEMICDCEVCCRPWRVVVGRTPDGSAQVVIDRAQ